jgi:uncharacterized protein DUF1259
MGTSKWRTRLVLVGVAALAGFATTDRARAASLDAAKIEQLTGAKGTLDDKAGVFKVSVPRSDLSVTVAGVKMSPPLGLTSWAAFEPAGDQTMVMGDMVLQEDQVVPVMDAALNNGLDVTGLHNHFVSDSPKVMFMHIGGMGSQESLATAVGKVLATIQQTAGGKGHVPTAAIDPGGSTLDAAAIDAILGSKGTMSGGVYKVVIGRTTKMHGYEVGATMGVNTWFAFAGSDQQAVVDGDFAMYEPELQPVLKALRKADIAVVAIHNHMTMEEPRVIFLHFWGVGPTRSLAAGIKSALDVQSK